MKEPLDRLYQHVRSLLTARYGAAEASAVAFALLEDLYGVGRTDVLLGKDKEFSAEERNDFEEIVKKIAEGLPMQYAVGRALFCGRYFKVTPDVLIPRVETEAVPLQLPSPEGSARVLDCGTGSGCIAITIALEHPDWDVEAWDISDAALAVARENAEALGAKNVRFEPRDILAEAESTGPLAGGGKQEKSFHYIVSNPPYICNKEAAEMEPHVLDHEPHTALFVPDNDPLLFYRALAEIGRARLVAGGCLFVECNRAYTEETAALFADYGFTDIEVIDDCFGVPRFVQGWR